MRKFWQWLFGSKTYDVTVYADVPQMVEFETFLGGSCQDLARKELHSPEGWAWKTYPELFDPWIIFRLPPCGTPANDKTNDDKTLDQIHSFCKARNVMLTCGPTQTAKSILGEVQKVEAHGGRVIAIEAANEPQNPDNLRKYFGGSVGTYTSWAKKLSEDLNALSPGLGSKVLVHTAKPHFWDDSSPLKPQQKEHHELFYKGVNDADTGLDLAVTTKDLSYESDSNNWEVWFAGYQEFFLQDSYTFWLNEVLAYNRDNGNSVWFIEHNIKDAVWSIAGTVLHGMKTLERYIAFARIKSEGHRITGACLQQVYGQNHVGAINYQNGETLPTATWYATTYANALFTYGDASAFTEDPLRSAASEKLVLANTHDGILFVNKNDFDLTIKGYEVDYVGGGNLYDTLAAGGAVTKKFNNISPRIVERSLRKEVIPKNSFGIMRAI